MLCQKIENLHQVTELSMISQTPRRINTRHVAYPPPQKKRKKDKKETKHKN